MYQGEVNVAQESLNTFLSVAEELQVKGLTQGQGGGGQQSQQPSTKHKSEADHSCSKPFNKARPSPAPASFTHHAQDPDTDDIQEVQEPYTDDIQEVVHIKPEPAAAHQGVTEEGAVALHEEQAEYEYENYGEDTGGLVDANVYDTSIDKGNALKMIHLYSLIILTTSVSSVVLFRVE